MTPSASEHKTVTDQNTAPDHNTVDNQNVFIIARCRAYYKDARNPPENSSRCFKCRRLFGAHKLISLHRYRNLELRGVNECGLHAAQYLAEAANSHGRVTSGQGDQIFDSASNFDIRQRRKTYAPGTDVQGLLRPIHLLLAQLNNPQREL